jgi:hypothetical protein
MVTAVSISVSHSLAISDVRCTYIGRSWPMKRLRSSSSGNNMTERRLETYQPRCSISGRESKHILLPFAVTVFDSDEIISHWT